MSNIKSTQIVKEVVQAMYNHLNNDSHVTITDIFKRPTRSASLFIKADFIDHIGLESDGSAIWDYLSIIERSRGFTPWSGEEIHAALKKFVSLDARCEWSSKTTAAVLAGLKD